MTGNENWVKNNSEVETEEKENGAVVLTGIAEEQVVEDENTTDDVVEVVDETSAETEDEVADDATDDETAETEESEEGSEEEENFDENSEDEKNDSAGEAKEGMSRTEKIVLAVIAVVLLALLIFLGLEVYNGMQERPYGIDDSNNSQISTTLTYDGDENDGEANDGVLDDQNNGEDDSDENTDNRPGKPSSNTTTSDKDGDNDDGNDKKDNSSTDSTNDGKDDNDDDSDKGDDGNNGKDNSKDDDGNEKDNDNGKENDGAVAEFVGETKVRITKISDDTGIITVTVGGEKIVVPVQTTVFNGRVTKSGVAQGKLFGFNCGATVMLYYPQEEGMSNTEFSGYMNRTGDSLTVLVDINGTDSKLLIKINGLKSL